MEDHLLICSVFVTCLCLILTMCNNCTAFSRIMMLKSLFSSLQLAERLKIHMAFLDLIFALTSTESLRCASSSIGKALGMQEGQPSSWRLFKKYTSGLK